VTGDVAASPSLGWDAVAALGFGCLLLTAFFSGIETGYMSVSRVRLRRLEESDGRARTLRRQLERLEDPILTCLIGTNLFNVLFSALVTVAFTERFGVRGEGLALLVSSTLVIIFGEIVPKSLYREFPERLTLASVRPLGLFMLLVAPVRVVLRGYGVFLRRLLPRRAAQESADFDRTSLTALLLTNALPETSDQRFREGIERFLELAGMDLRRIMRPVEELTVVTHATTVGQACEIAARSGFSRLPVVAPGGRTPEGYVFVRDLLFWAGDPETPLPESLVRSFLLVDSELSPYELLEEFHAQGRQIALIVDRAGDALGMTTLEDLLEAVVGSIQDEFDTRYELVRATRGGRGRGILDPAKERR
jgi:CBS domain containing-hemolysin-like protein